jgi:hypothetical protein
MTEIPSIQIVVPGSSDITLPQPGEYTIFYEYRSMVDNRIYSTDQDIPAIIVNIVSTDTGDEIALTTPSTSSTYTIGGRSGIGLFDFSIDKPGIYEISASYPAARGQQEVQTQEIVLAVIHSSIMDHIFGTIMGTVAGAMAIVFVPLAAGGCIHYYNFLKETKSKNKNNSTMMLKNRGSLTLTTS